MAQTQDTLNSFNVGDHVYFGRGRGEQTLGEVVSKGRSKLKIKQLESRGTNRAYPVGTLWTVPPSLCRPANESASTAPAAKSTLKVGQTVEFQGYSWEKRGMGEVVGVVTSVTGNQIEVWNADSSVIQVKSESELTKRRKRTDEAILKSLLSVDSRLSPENLSCDGEVRGRALQQKAAALRRARRALEIELGRKMTESQVWQAAR